MKKTKEKEEFQKKEAPKTIGNSFGLSTSSLHFQSCYKKNFNLLIRHYTRKSEKSSQLGL